MATYRKIHADDLSSADFANDGTEQQGGIAVKTGAGSAVGTAIAAAIASAPPGAASSVPASGVTAGTLPAGVNIPAAQVSGFAAAALAAVPNATDSVAGIASLAVAANHPSTSDAESATPAYVAAAIGAIPSASTSVAGIVNLASGQALGSGDKTINGVTIGRGGGDVASNTASGYLALPSNIDGAGNTASGYLALYSNIDGDGNTASGYTALYSNIGGGDNTANGRAALYNNVAYNNTSGFGYNAQVTGSDQVQLGDAATTTYVYGTVQNRSDLRDKTDAKDSSLGLDFVLKLKPIEWRWDMREYYREPIPEIEQNQELDKDPGKAKKAAEKSKAKREEWLAKNKLGNLKSDGSKAKKRKHFGFGAQDVKKVIDEIGVDFGGFQDHSVNGGDDVMSLGYDEFIAPIVKAIQEQNEMILALQAEVKRLTSAKK